MNEPTPDPDNPPPYERPHIGGHADPSRPEHRGVTGGKGPLSNEDLRTIAEGLGDPAGLTDPSERLHWREEDESPVEPEPKRWSMASVLMVCAGVLGAGIIVIASIAGGCVK